MLVFMPRGLVGRKCHCSETWGRRRLRMKESEDENRGLKKMYIGDQRIRATRKEALKG